MRKVMRFDELLKQMKEMTCDVTTRCPYCGKVQTCQMFIANSGDLQDGEGNPEPSSLKFMRACEVCGRVEPHQVMKIVERGATK